MANFCPECGAATRLEIPPGDNRQRDVCSACREILYVNPRIVVGAVCTRAEKILLCRRAIEPRAGFWTVPAGFMELGESAEDGACRETLEEAGAHVDIDDLLGVYSVPRIDQVHLFFAATITDPRIAAGTESLEARLFEWDQIPWDIIAFPSAEWALIRYQQWKMGRLPHDPRQTGRGRASYQTTPSSSPILSQTRPEGNHQR